MCCSSEVFKDLCLLFPQTEENILVRARKRRVVFMTQKRTRSKKWQKKKDDNPELQNDDSEISFYDSEEDQGEHDQQKEEMQKYLEDQVVNLESVNKALMAANQHLSKVIDYKEDVNDDILKDNTSIMDIFQSHLNQKKVEAFDNSNDVEDIIQPNLN